MMKLRNLASGLILILFLFALSGYGQINYPGKHPGLARVEVSNTDRGKELWLENDVLSAHWLLSDNKMLSLNFKDKVNKKSIILEKEPLFSLAMEYGTIANHKSFRIMDRELIKDADINPASKRAADKLKGKTIALELINDSLGIHLHWEATLRNGSNYIQQSFNFYADKPVKINSIKLLNLPFKSNIKASSRVDGSPLVTKSMFFAIEHPMAKSIINDIEISSFLPRSGPLDNQVLKISTVWGVTPKDQLRRGFLYYVERERAAPYHQFLHYNSWYDLSWVDRKLEEKSSLNRIQTYADSLIVKRKVPMDGFLFDDGWDDNESLWQFNKNFSEGFTNLNKLARKFNSGVGVWMSPWGGYDEPKLQRLKYGQSQNPPFEINENGFTLTGENYNKRFTAISSKFARDYSIKIFKFDGVGAGNGADGASLDYQKDIEEFVKLISGLRSINPKIYFSLTVGTWPSPYWLNYGDAIWRAGDDTGMQGKGSKRQQWLNYRDAEAYKNTALRSPLYPLNSLMYHGICIADNGKPASFEMNDKDIEDEIWSFFGNGTSLQELYINPHKLNSTNWDCLAKAAAWAKANENVLVDVHWVGGDPAKEEVYGYAAWNNDRGVITLRNPSSQRKAFKVEVGQVFDLPEDTNKNYFFYDAKASPKDNSSLIASGDSFTISLEPFEVKVMNAQLMKK